MTDGQQNFTFLLEIGW